MQQASFSSTDTLIQTINAQINANDSHSVISLAVSLESTRPMGFFSIFSILYSLSDKGNTAANDAVELFSLLFLAAKTNVAMQEKFDKLMEIVYTAASIDGDSGERGEVEALRNLTDSILEKMADMLAQAGLINTNSPNNYIRNASSYHELSIKATDVAVFNINLN